MTDALAYGLIVVAALLAVFVTGVLTVGSQLVRRPPADALPERSVIGPFVGVAPASADPSLPERGELVLSFDARFGDLAIMHFRMSVYADRRDIWTSEGGLHGRAPRNAVIGQRLTSAGIAALRSLVTDGGRVIGSTTVGADPVTWVGRASSGVR